MGMYKPHHHYRILMENAVRESFLIKSFQNFNKSGIPDHGIIDHLFAYHELYQGLSVSHKTIHCQIPDQRAPSFAV